MKTRPEGFLSNKELSHDSEQFDYIRELHEYLWQFVRTQIPHASGNIKEYIDAAIEVAEGKVEEEAMTPDEEIEYLLSVILDLFAQACYYKNTDGIDMYDHKCISSYEEAQKLLLEKKMIKKEQCYRLP